MKFSINEIIFPVHCFFLSVLISAQKTMKVDDTLKAKSEAMLVKMRGGTLMKYDFGDYNTITAKAGWGSGKSRMSKGIEESESKQKSFIELKNNSNDTCFINISLNETSESIRQRVISFSEGRVAWEREREPSKSSKVRNLIAAITTNIDTTTWNLVYVIQTSNQGVDQNYSYAFITDGNQSIEIKKVTVWDNGKSPRRYSVVGFEFYRDGVVVAAVQNPMDAYQKKFVWLKNDLDEYMKLILASASSVLFSFTNQPSG